MHRLLKQLEIETPPYHRRQRERMLRRRAQGSGAAGHGIPHTAGYKQLDDRYTWFE